MTDMTINERAQEIRIEALRMATDGVGKTRFNPDLVIATAVKYADYIANGTVPEPSTPPAPLNRLGTKEEPARGRGRPRKATATGEGG